MWGVHRHQAMLPLIVPITLGIMAYTYTLSRQGGQKFEVNLIYI